jgi:hypothetical protein
MALLMFVVWFGFEERDSTAISAFDFHAIVMVLGGSLAAILISSSAVTAMRTLVYLRELVPGLGTLGRATEALEAERVQLTALWREGRRAQAVELAERSSFPPTRKRPAQPSPSCATTRSAAGSRPSPTGSCWRSWHPRLEWWAPSRA